jgi:GR25 family glycosyltransferase involved in LPS biosynthesis
MAFLRRFCLKWRDYFDRVSIINLPERGDRRAEMLCELQRAGLDPEPGRIEFFPAIKMNEAAGFLNAGYHGCFRSHLEVLKRAFAAGARNIAVLEDDAAITDRFRHDEEALVEQLHATDWGIAYFGHGLEAPAARPTMMQPYAGKVMLAHFYAVNAPVLGRLIDYMEKCLHRPFGHPDGGPMSPDGALSFFRARNPDVQTLVTSPNLAVQRSSRSDLTPKWFDSVPIVAHLFDLLRKAKRQLMRK